MERKHQEMHRFGGRIDF